MVLYNKSKFEKLKIKFENSESIQTNFSQSYQDMFVLSMLNGKKNGFFLEIGAYNPTFISNTYLLESSFGWDGISIDIDPNVRGGFVNSRKSTFILHDALTIDYKELLLKNNSPKQIDYLQIDIEPLTQTYDCLMKIPFDEYRFSVITYETDYYDPATPQDVKEKVRQESRNFLQNLGYELVVGDVESNIGFPYEDWYVDPKIVDSKTYELLKHKHDSLLPDHFMLY